MRAMTYILSKRGQTDLVFGMIRVHQLRSEHVFHKSLYVILVNTHTRTQTALNLKTQLYYQLSQPSFTIVKIFILQLRVATVYY